MFVSRSVLKKKIVCQFFRKKNITESNNLAPPRNQMVRPLDPEEGVDYTQAGVIQNIGYPSRPIVQNIYPVQTTPISARAIGLNLE